MTRRFLVLLFLLVVCHPGARGSDGNNGSKPARKFETPVTHPEARWKRETIPVLGSGLKGYLDGPANQVQVHAGPSRGAWYESGGEYMMRALNPVNNRYYTIGGRARGYLDGPLSRARFGGHGYMRFVSSSQSRDGRYLYFTEPDLGGILRCIDFKEQMVSTLIKKKLNGKMTTNRKGELLIARKNGVLTYFDPKDGSSRDVKLGFGGAGEVGPLLMSWVNIGLDEVNGRLYASNRQTGDWTVWYWDLKDNNKFVGIIKHPKKGTAKPRSLNVTGPFDGANFHCPGGIAFGPDDPEKRFLYFGGGDNTTFYRLDLKKREFVHFGPPAEEKKKPPYMTLGFVHDKRLPFGSVSKWCGTPGWDKDGNIYLGVSLGYKMLRFKRVK